LWELFLKPGVRIKRWILILIGSCFTVALSLSGEINLDIISIHINIYVRIVLFLCGTVLFLFGIYKLLFRLFSFINFNLTHMNKKEIFDALYTNSILKKGAKIVAIGGGTGLSTMLRGLKRLSTNITAVVTVADDGGGSGIIREDLGMLPPGDIRNCILALAHTEDIMQRLLQYRFTEGSLKGQSFGNLFLAAMTGVANSFEKAVKYMSDVLAVQGKVLPVSLESIHLGANLENGNTVIGESKIPDVVKLQNTRISNVFLLPEKPKVNIEVIDEIKSADLIIIGPGSLYTSILPNLLFDDIVQAIKSSSAKKIYIANVMTQPGETDGMSLAEHIEVIERHCKGRLFDIIIVNNQAIPDDILEKYRKDGAEPIYTDDGLTLKGYVIIKDNLLSTKDGYVRHSPSKLANVISQVAYGKNVIKDYKRFSVIFNLFLKFTK